MRDATVTLWALAPFVFALWPDDGWQVPSVPQVLFLLALVPMTAGVLIAFVLGELKPPEPRYASL